MICAVSQIPIAPFNRVMGVRLRAEEVEQVVGAVREAHSQAGVPGSWWLDPGSTPSGLDQVLLGLGYVAEGTVAAMAIDLADLPAVELPPGAELSWVAGRESMRYTQRMVGLGFGMPAAFVEEMADRLSVMGDDPDGVTRVAVVKLNGVPVSSAMSATVGDVAGVYSVVTLSEARGKGLGRAVTLAVLHDARDRGASMAVLEASVLGFPVYARIGFQHVGDFRLFVSGS